DAGVTRCLDHLLSGDGILRLPGAQAAHAEAAGRGEGIALLVGRHDVDVRIDDHAALAQSFAATRQSDTYSNQVIASGLLNCRRSKVNSGRPWSSFCMAMPSWGKTRRLLPANSPAERKSGWRSSRPRNASTLFSTDSRLRSSRYASRAAAIRRRSSSSCTW